MTEQTTVLDGLAFRWSWRLLMLAPALALGVACGSSGAAEGGAAQPGGGRGGAPMAMPVGIVELAPEPVDDISEFVGVLKSRRSSDIQPQAEGFITRILVRSGDRVAVGTPLFEIDNSSQQAVVASLESTRAARESDAAFAKQQLERAKKLLDVGASSQQEYDQALNAARTAEAQLKAVDEQIRHQKNELAYYRVVAPTAGVVGDVPVRVGDRVTKATTLTTVDDNSGLEIYINVPVQQATRLRVGLPVRLMDEAGQVIATERLNFVSASVDEETQTVLAKAPITARGSGFRSEQFVRARIVWASDPGLVIPVTSVLRISGQHFVFVAEPADGGLVARQRSVQVGQVIGQNYLVQGGLKAGERVVVSGIQKIGDGVPVQPAPPPGAAGARGTGAQPPAGGGQ
jgi:RND family efflux transporter MFP subunit